jgi:hypothetical protein
MPDARAKPENAPMLIGLDAFPTDATRSIKKPATRGTARAVIDTAIALWSDDDVPTMRRAEAEARDRDVAVLLLDGFRAMLEEIGTVRAAELGGLRVNTEVLIAGARISTARTGKTTVVSLEDGTGRSDAEFASDAQARAGSVLFGTDLMLIGGTMVANATIRATNAWDLRQLLRDWAAQRERSAADLSDLMF